MNVAAEQRLIHLVQRRERLSEEIGKLANERDAIEAEIIGIALPKWKSPPLPPMQTSQRQTEVLYHLQQQLSNKEIGDKLNITERTVKFHVGALLKKYKKKSRRELGG